MKLLGRARRYVLGQYPGVSMKLGYGLLWAATCSGPGEIFVYYTVDKTEPGKPAIHGLRRCRTGIRAGTGKETP